MTRLPISAIVVFRNERELLEGCLSRLGFCDELILVDMASTDGSRRVAARYSDRIYDWPAEPIADPARVRVARYCRNPWILIVDPDEHYPPALVELIRVALGEHADTDAGGFRLPTRFYFKRRALTGTIWGGDHHSKLVLIHRRRGQLLPYCNRIIEVRDGFETVTLPNTDDNHIRHYWSDSYRDLLHKHVYRYPLRDARRLVVEGHKFNWRWVTIAPMRALKQSLIDRDGWRMGPRGWALSAIYALYHLLIGCCLLFARRDDLAARRPGDVQAGKRLESTELKHERKAA